MLTPSRAPSKPSGTPVRPPTTHALIPQSLTPRAAEGASLIARPAPGKDSEFRGSTPGARPAPADRPTWSPPRREPSTGWNNGSSADVNRDCSDRYGSLQARLSRPGGQYDFPQARNPFLDSLSAHRGACDSPPLPLNGSSSCATRPPFRSSASYACVPTSCAPWMNFRFTRYSYWPFVWFPVAARDGYDDSWSARGYDPSWNDDYPNQPNVFIDVPPAPDAQDGSPQGVDLVAPHDGGASITTLIEGVDALVDEGISAFAAGDSAAARRAFAAAVARDPNDPYARILYAWTWLAEGDPVLASASIRLALKEFPQVLDRPLDVRPLYRDRRTLDAQVAAMFEHVARHPEDRDARFLLGYVLFTIEQPQGAWDVLLPLTESGEVDALAADLVGVLAEILGVEAPVAAPVMPEDTAAPPPESPAAQQDSSQNFDEAEGA